MGEKFHSPNRVFAIDLSCYILNMFVRLFCLEMYIWLLKSILFFVIDPLERGEMEYHIYICIGATIRLLNRDDFDQSNRYSLKLIKFFTTMKERHRTTSMHFSVSFQRDNAECKTQ